MNDLVRHFVHALRSLWRASRSTTLSVLLLALGVGGVTVGFTVLDRVLLRPLPYPHPEQLLFVWSSLPEGGYRRAPLSGPEVDDLRRNAAGFRDFGAIWATQGTLVESGRPEGIRVGLVTARFLSVLGVEPALGRGFTSGEEGPGTPGAVILSDGLWRRRFGADPEILGRKVRVDGGWGFTGGVYPVVGVMPEGFRMVLPPDAGIPADVDLWVPFDLDLAATPRTVYYLRTVGRIAPGTTLEAGQGEVARVGREVVASYPDYGGGGRAFQAVALHADAVDAVRPAVLALFGGLVFILLISAANVTSLLVARLVDRRRELAVRGALGATRTRLASELLTQEMLVAAAAAGVGLVAAAWGLDLLASFLPLELPTADTTLRLDWRGVAFGAAVAVFCGLLLGLVSLARCGIKSVPAALRAPGLGGAGRSRLHRALVVAEIALGIVLLVGAGLGVRSLLALGEIDLGFRPERVLTVRLSLPPERYASQQAVTSFSRDLERELSRLPGVKAVGAINQLPLDGLPNWSTPYTWRGEPLEATHQADARVASPGYLAAAGMRLRQGRWFQEGDSSDARPVVVVDPLLAETAWPGRDAVGQELQVEVWDGEGFVPKWAEVVGVVEPVRHLVLTRQVREQVFVPFAQGARNQMALALRVSGDPLDWAGATRQVVAALDPDLATAEILPLQGYLDRVLAVPRFVTALALVLAAVALTLAGTGLYGLISWTVARRRAEIALRVALGATPRDLLALVVGQSLRLAALGTSIGVAGVLALGSFLRSTLYGVAAFDLTLVIAAALTLALASVLAGWLPARRVLRLEPVTSLRSE